eukprot:s275_g11.t1
MAAVASIPAASQVCAHWYTVDFRLSDQDLKLPPGEYIYSQIQGPEHSFRYRFLPGGTSQGYQAAPMDDGLMAQPITTSVISTPVPMAGAVYYPSTQVAYAPLAASVATSTPVPMEPMMAAGSSAVQGPPTQSARTLSISFDDYLPGHSISKAVGCPGLSHSSSRWH